VHTCKEAIGGVLEKKTQKCALRVHFTVGIENSLLGENWTKIGLFHRNFFSKRMPNHPNNAQINSKFVGNFSPPRIRHFDEISGVLI
jgi:hypothetical protein